MFQQSNFGNYSSYDWFSDSWVFLGLFIPGVLIAYAIWILVDGSAHIPPFNLRRGQIEVTGTTAQIYGLTMLSTGLALHCHSFWGRFKRLWQLACFSVGFSVGSSVSPPSRER